MSLRDYDKLTPRERREKADPKPCATCSHPYASHRADGKPDSRYMTACNAPCDCEGYVHADYHDLRLRGVDYQPKLTRTCPEAPPDTREDEKDSCQDKSVDGGVSVKPYEMRISWNPFADRWRV